jgi:hypothetical protein
MSLYASRALNIAVAKLCASELSRFNNKLSYIHSAPAFQSTRCLDYERNSPVDAG